MKNDDFYYFNFDPMPDWTEVNNRIIESAGKLYLCGRSIKDYLGADMPRKIFAYAGGGFCYEWAAVAMMVVRGADFTDVRLVQGIATLPNGDSGTHAMLLFKYHGQEYVIDFSNTPFAITREDYEATAKLEERWVLPERAFWGYEESKQLYLAMRYPDTSNVFWELGIYRPDAAGNKITTRYGLSWDPVYTKTILENDRLGLDFRPVRTMRGRDITPEIIAQLFAASDQANSLPGRVHHL